VVLPPLQIAVLQSGRVGPDFFAALSRVRTIHEHCKGLLRSHHQRAGLDLMDQMAAHQEAAYEHLCRCVCCPAATWQQSACASVWTMQV